MRFLLFAALLCVVPVWGDDAAENVNSKYVVESIEIVPASVAKRLSSQIKTDMDSLVGQKFDPEATDKVAKRIADDVHRDVRRRIEKGTQPEHVKVIYSARRVFEADADVTKFAYHSTHGWTGGLQTDFDLAGLTFRAGVQTDSDHLLERYAGYTLGVERRIQDRVRLRLDFGDFHQQWNATTLRASEANPDLPGIYRERYILSPTVSVAVTEGLALTVGMDIHHFQTQFPAARFEAANAVTTTLRYRGRWSSDASRQEVDAGYGLRAATRTLGSDYVYARHVVRMEYKGVIGQNSFSAEFLGGRVDGRTPLFDRFVLGDSRTLRGWSKFDVAPLGGSRVAHGSVEYTYRWIGCFFDTGSVWRRDDAVNVRHSAGVSVGGRDDLFIALAFPLRSGSIQPLFILGMNF